MYVIELKALIKFVQFFNIITMHTKKSMLLDFCCIRHFVKNAKISFNLKIFIIASLTKPMTD